LQWLLLDEQDALLLNSHLPGALEGWKRFHRRVFQGFLPQTPGRTRLALRMIKAMSMFARIAVTSHGIGMLALEQSETQAQVLAEKAK
jgi:hypothetical protein